MSDDLYNVIFGGRALEGRDENEVKHNLASIFKISIEDVQKRFTGKPVIIKSKVDLETAEKFKAAFDKAGAECLIKPVSAPPPAQTAPAPSIPAEPEPALESSDEENASVPSQDERVTEKDSPAIEPLTSTTAQAPAKASGPNVISPPQRAVSLQFTPVECRALAATSGGMNFNRYGCEDIAYTELLLVSVYNVPSGMKTKTRIMLFIEKQKKPLVLDTSLIHYDDFAGVKADDEYVSLRSFLSLLVDRKPGLYIDEGTNRFLSGGSPETLKKEEPLWSSALGAVLDADELFKLPAMMPKAAKPQPQSGAAPASEATAAPASPVKQSSARQPDELTEQDYLAMFVGPNANKYLHKFANFTGGFQATWHWPAFFFPFFWFLYRKLWLYALGAFFVMMIPFIGWIGVMIASGLSAYYIYYRHAKGTIERMRLTAGNMDISGNVAREGGVSGVSVAVSASLIFLLSVGIFVLGIYIPTKLKEKQDKFAESMNVQPGVPGMPSFPGMPQMPPGMPQMPQNPQEAMNMAFDVQAQVELRQVCTLAQIQYAENPTDFITMSSLREYGYNEKPEVTIEIINPYMDTLSISARHVNGTKTFLADSNCEMTEQ